MLFRTHTLDQDRDTICVLIRDLWGHTELSLHLIEVSISSSIFIDSWDSWGFHSVFCGFKCKYICGFMSTAIDLGVVKEVDMQLIFTLQ